MADVELVMYLVYKSNPPITLDLNIVNHHHKKIDPQNILTHILPEYMTIKETPFMITAIMLDSRHTLLVSHCANKIRVCCYFIVFYDKVKHQQKLDSLIL